jgi:DNA-binding transcriptional LysR family regulator
MDIDSIRTFLSLAETGSFSRTAEALHVTQPAVSKRIAALEHLLDCALFDRLGKEVHLTQAGKALLPSYQRVMAELDESRRIISSMKTEVRGQLRFGTSHHIGLHRLPPVLRQYSELHPDVELDIQFMDSEQAATLILKGSIELALITLPGHVAEPLATQPIWTDPMYCVCAPEHPLAKQKTVSRRELQQHGVILQASNTHTRNIVEKALQLGTQNRVVMESNYLETIKAMIQNNLGWGVLPESMIDKSLVKLSVNKSKMKRELGVIYHAARTLSNPASALSDLLQQHTSS